MFVRGIRRQFNFPGYVVDKITVGGRLGQVILRRDRRVMLNGVFWILHTGAPWRDLPERFGPWQTVYDHFARIVEALQIKLDRRGLIDWDLWCMDGSNVQASRAAAGASKKVASGTRRSRPTTRWAAAEAGLDRSSIWLLTARELRSSSK